MSCKQVARYFEINRNLWTLISSGEFWRVFIWNHVFFWKINLTLPKRSVKTMKVLLCSGCPVLYSSVDKTLWERIFGRGRTTGVIHALLQLKNCHILPERTNPLLHLFAEPHSLNSMSQSTTKIVPFDANVWKYAHLQCRHAWSQIAT